MITDWLWNYRKLILLEIVLIGLLEAMYWLPRGLPWWLLGVAVTVVIFAWWIGNAKFKRDIWIFIGELLWSVLSGIGWLAFSLFNLWQAQLAIGVIAVAVAFISYSHQRRIDTNQWSLPAINWLGSIDLLILFVATLSLMLLVR